MYEEVIEWISLYSKLVTAYKMAFGLLDICTVSLKLIFYFSLHTPT